MSKPKRKTAGVDPSRCQHGLWPKSSLVDGRFRSWLLIYETALEELAYRLQVADEAAAFGAGATDAAGIVAVGHGASAVEARLNRNGELADEEVQALRKLRSDHLRALRQLVHKLEADLGQRPPLKGPRDQQGRLRIVSG